MASAALMLVSTSGAGWVALAVIPRALTTAARHWNLYRRLLLLHNFKNQWSGTHGNGWNLENSWRFKSCIRFKKYFSVLFPFLIWILNSTWSPASGWNHQHSPDLWTARCSTSLAECISILPVTASREDAADLNSWAMRLMWHLFFSWLWQPPKKDKWHCFAVL